MTSFTIENLYQDYRDKIFTMAFRILGNKDDAEDITQETFINAHRYLNTFKGNSHISTWLFSISKNLCFQLLKNRKKQSFSQIETLINTASTELGKGLHTNLEIKSMAEQVKHGCLTGLLQCLSPNQRSAFVLMVLLGFSVRQTSQILDKSGGAVKVLVHRARQNLKQFLCRKCSLYNPKNPCQCENLIEFSLKQGWVKKQSSQTIEFTVSQIETRLKDLQKIANLYQSLPKQKLSTDLNRQIFKHLF